MTPQANFSVCLFCDATSDVCALWPHPSVGRLELAALRLLDEPLLLLLVVLAHTPARLTLAPATAEDPMDEWWLHRLCQTCQRFGTVRELRCQARGRRRCPKQRDRLSLR